MRLRHEMVSQSKVEKKLEVLSSVSYPLLSFWSHGLPRFSSLCLIARTHVRRCAEQSSSSHCDSLRMLCAQGMWGEETSWFFADKLLLKREITCLLQPCRVSGQVTRCHLCLILNKQIFGSFHHVKQRHYIVSRRLMNQTIYLGILVGSVLSVIWHPAPPFADRSW